MCPDEARGDFGILAGDRFMSEKEAAAQSVYVLAFLGDGVYSLLAREYVTRHFDEKAGDLHRRSVSLVNAAAQAAGYHKIKDVLTEQEAAVYRRARNARSTHTPKNMREGEYHCATGVEALFGYLYLSGQRARLYALLEMIAEPETQS